MIQLACATLFKHLNHAAHSMAPTRSNNACNEIMCFCKCKDKLNFLSTCRTRHHLKYRSRTPARQQTWCRSSRTSPRSRPWTLATWHAKRQLDLYWDDDVHGNLMPHVKHHISPNLEPNRNSHVECNLIFAESTCVWNRFPFKKPENKILSPEAHTMRSKILADCFP